MDGTRCVGRRTPLASGRAPDGRQAAMMQNELMDHSFPAELDRLVGRAAAMAAAVAGRSAERTDREGAREPDRPGGGLGVGLSQPGPLTVLLGVAPAGRH